MAIDVCINKQLRMFALGLFVEAEAELPQTHDGDVLQQGMTIEALRSLYGEQGNRSKNK